MGTQRIFGRWLGLGLIGLALASLGCICSGLTQHWSCEAKAELRQGRGCPSLPDVGGMGESELEQLAQQRAVSSCEEMLATILEEAAAIECALEVRQTCAITACRRDGDFAIPWH